MLARTLRSTPTGLRSHHSAEHDLSRQPCIAGRRGLTVWHHVHSCQAQFSFGGSCGKGGLTGKGKRAGVMQPSAAFQNDAGVPERTLVKVCGITSVEDALHAAKSGADFIGMIMWPKAKRSISVETAARIAAVAREHGAQPVGVFVDEDAATISSVCKQAGLGIAQLHGPQARDVLWQLPAELHTVYVMHAHPDGRIETTLTPRPATAQPSDASSSSGGSSPALRQGADWLLVDGLQGGSGQAFDWAQLRPPQGVGRLGWLLAGGLHPGNVAEAVRIARPTAVDVSSGVCGPDGLKKDHSKVTAFIEAARDCFTASSNAANNSVYQLDVGKLS